MIIFLRVYYFLFAFVYNYYNSHFTKYFTSFFKNVIVWSRRKETSESLDNDEPGNRTTVLPTMTPTTAKVAVVRTTSAAPTTTSSPPTFPTTSTLAEIYLDCLDLYRAGFTESKVPIKKQHFFLYC
jgi:hypothetical protein